jgi:guanylate kinase
MAKHLILVIGKTSSGKDTVAKHIGRKYDIPMVCSYTTRPMRDYEEDGVQHYFVSKEKMKEIMETESIVAYTKFPKTGVEYCATLEAIKSDIAVYIIDPSGVEWFKENGCIDDVSLTSIYVDLSEEEIQRRAKKRGDKTDSVKNRLDSEREQFDAFKESKEYDYLIDNSGTYKELLCKVDAIMEEAVLARDSREAELELM